MTQTRFFEHDDFLGTTKWFHYDDIKDDGSFTIETVQDVEPIIESNKYEANNAERKPGREWTRVAAIPPMIWMQLVQSGIANDEAALRKWLDDRDNRLFRCNNEKLSRTTT
jgi:hypothetical protein